MDLIFLERGITTVEVKKFYKEVFNKQESVSLPLPNEKEENELINAKYVKGEMRLVTEQARYPLPTLIDMFDKSSTYELQPDFQRRKNRWDNDKRSKLIESFIINVPIPPVFLYEVSYANYEVMDGLQRITTIIDFYKDEFELSGLEQWQELNGRKYSNLPEKIKEGIDRRYLSSIILLNESAPNTQKATEMKQLVFERLNTGGEKLSAQEIRNAIYNGKMNKLCLKLSSNEIFKKLWNIKIDNDISPQKDKLFSDMSDVELVLRFFAMRFIDRFTGNLDYFLDTYLKNANSYPDETLLELENLFLRNINIAYDLLGDKAFKIYKTYYGKLNWSSEAQRTIYDPLMIVLTKLELTEEEVINSDKKQLLLQLQNFYKENEEKFDGKRQGKSETLLRTRLLYKFFCSFFNREVAYD